MATSTSPFMTPQQRTTEREAKRAAVLRAAVQMFNERGFHNTSLDEVAASLGITKPTIYHYLGNKDRVLLECVTHGLHALLSAAHQSRATPGKGADRLRAFLLSYAENILNDFGRCVIRTSEDALGVESRKQFRELKRKIDMAMRELIQEAISDGSIAQVDPQYLAFTLAGALNWSAQWHNPDGLQSPSEVAEQLVDILAQGFLPR